MALWQRLFRSQSLRAAAVFAAGGFGFAAGNIVLAMVLPAADFGVVALLLALNQFCLTFGSFGMDVVINRHRPQLDRAFASQLLTAATLTAIVAGLLARLYYRLPIGISALLLVMVVGSTINRVVAAIFQEERRFGGALALLQIHNYTLLVAAGVVAWLARPDGSIAVAVVAVGYLCTAVYGWWSASRTMNTNRRRIPLAVLLREGLAVVGLNVAVQTLFQFERLAIPKVASMSMLATYAVLAAVAASPFRMIQLGNAFTLLPRMRSASNAQVAHGVVRGELMTAVLVTVASAAAVAVGAPLVFHYLLHDKYTIGWSLLAVVIAMGVVRVWEGFSTTIVAALGTARHLATLSLISWLSLAVAAAGALLGSAYGLLGILYGMLGAWLTLAGGGTWLAQRSFQARFAAPETVKTGTYS